MGCSSSLEKVHALEREKLQAHEREKLQAHEREKLQALERALEREKEKVMALERALVVERHTKDREVLLMAAKEKELIAAAKEKELELHLAVSREREQAAVRGRGREQVPVLSCNRLDSRVQIPLGQPRGTVQAPLPPRLAPSRTPPLPHLKIQMNRQPPNRQPSTTNAVAVAARKVPTIPPHQLYAEPQLQHSSEPPSLPKRRLGTARAHLPSPETTSVAESAYQVATSALVESPKPTPIASSVQAGLARKVTDSTFQYTAHSPSSNSSDCQSVSVVSVGGQGLSSIHKPGPKEQHGSSTVPSTEVTTPAAVVEIKHDFFLSHFQATGGDQVMALELRLSVMGFDCWLDQNAHTITKESMAAGVTSSTVFLLFLSKGVLSRPFCIFGTFPASYLARYIVRAVGSKRWVHEL